MNKGQLQEQISQLYLRLNGFFTSGFVVHSPIPGRVRSEVDILAVRFPHHSEYERIEPDDLALDLSNQHLELAICEVKSRGQQVRFNDTLYNSEPAIESLLRWVGIFSPEGIPLLVPKVKQLLCPCLNPAPVIPTLQVGPSIRIRGSCFPQKGCSLPDIINRGSRAAKTYSVS